MSIFLAALLLTGSTPNGDTAANQTAPAAAKKPKQVCEMIEITGSRSKRRVCHNQNGDLDLGPGVSDSAFGKARIEQGAHGSAPTAPGGSI